MFVAIRNTPRDYAWGSHTAIAEFRGVEPSGSPEAELWLGAHAGSPAEVVEPDDAGAADLAELIAANPALALGPAHAREGARLPFLLKVLAAARPLSLQAHPTPDQARTGFGREEAEGVPIDAFDRNYKDPFAKPELIVAVSESFEALSGFRRRDEVRGVLDALRTADAASPEPQPGALDLLASRLDGPDGLRESVGWLLQDGRGDDSGEAAWLVERVTALAASDAALDSPYAASFRTVLDLAEEYPGDPGIVISLLLNRVTLGRGEALFLDAGNIHAYLSGLGIELMAASDNVLRGGLTPKHVDVPELLEVLDFTPIEPPVLSPVEAAPGVLEYRPAAPDFTLFRVEGADDAARIALAGPAIVLAEGGDVQVAGAHGSIAIARGEAAFVSPDEASLAFGGDGVAWVATVPPAQG
ncbi:putative mannose-6-phosphate isomerase ManA [Agromyces luteolus]|uniref:mannose-6-phosphate isomerase n=1 Tax=Agromyces luteolus TaxID=88373 RepID=A0A7C9LCX4_9MICO|nr:mannose-6-phosphate isomerase, class I [Agromyces luteolus]MUN07012.1 mannose-6-phosphate isomerase, class I [Agromyces luteolus]GLK28381.1 putative mannose-6-phosphate isomerase ManA [Agromyces luteolus]